MKYKASLRADILAYVAPLEIKSYATLVNKSRVAEDYNKRLAIQRTKVHKRRQASQVQQPE